MPRLEGGLKSLDIKMTDHHNGYFDAYYNKITFGEPRQKIFAVMRFEKRGQQDVPGWYIKEITTDQNKLMKIAKDCIAFPATDGQGWVSNVHDVMIVEIIPTDFDVDNI